MPSTPARLPAGLLRRAVLAAVVAAASSAVRPSVAFAADPAPAAPAADATPPAAAAPAPAAGDAAATPAASASTPAERFPEPSLYPTSWELDFTHGTPKRIVVRVPGSPTKAYWYMTYSVTNRGEQDVDFDPVFEMLADDGKTHRANRAIPAEVFEAIKKREGNKLLETPRKMTGTVRAGEDQTRDGVAIWPEPMLRMGTFTIFVGGLSGESLMMKQVGGQFVPIDPKKAAEELKGVKDEDRINLRKQYSVTYRVLGDHIAPGNDPIQKRAPGG